ncbi:MAG: hypothetical protein JNM45_16050 [Rhizobiales bacterium]|nr:hypothetical protein [Hyphomicrobiales bacterium]
MENRRSLNDGVTLLAAPLAVLLLATAQPDAPRPKVLAGPEIIAAFEGKTVAGAYHDGLAFRETYFNGGKIDYWDPRATSTGNWSVVNNLFCTFYGSMTGGCFTIVQISGNCFDFYAATDSEQQALAGAARADYTARGAVQGAASTCPDDLQV